MLNTEAVEQFDARIPGVYAFRIKGKLADSDMESMADIMNAAFDKHDKVDMLLSFDGEAKADLGAGLSLDVLRSRVRALSNVRTYAVANAPDGAESVIEFFGNILPVKAETFSSEHNALEHLRSLPALK